MNRSVVIVPGGIGGTGGLSIDVANLAAELVRRDWRVTLAGGQPSDPALRDLRDVHIEPLRPILRSRASQMFALRAGMGAVIRREHSPVVHVFGCMPSYTTVAAFASAHRRRLPLIWTPMFHPLRSRVWRLHASRLPMIGFDAIAPFASRLATAVGAATDTEQEVFRRVGARAVTMLPPAVKRVSPAPLGSAEAFRRSTGVGDAPLIVVVASRDEPRKGLAFAWEAFARLRGELPEAVLCVVGLESTHVAPPEGVQLLGRVDDQALHAALRAADVVFVPSLFEAFSRVVIEAWQQSTSVVVSDGVALASRVAEIGGTVVPYGDATSAANALRVLLADPDEARRQGRAGRRVVTEEYELTPVVDAVERVYLDALEETDQCSS